MPSFSAHKCPKCRTQMEKTDNEIKHSKRYKRVWDLGLTGSGVTTTSTTSGSDYSDVSATLPPEALDTKMVSLIAYRCPKCKYEESYRE